RYQEPGLRGEDVSGLLGRPGEIAMIRFFTPKGLHLKAQGRAAHPGSQGEGSSYPEGVASNVRRCIDGTPSGYPTSWRGPYPGCAARPWALGRNPFGVTTALVLICVLLATTNLAYAQPDAEL